jgi:hypothetical protein
MAASFLRSASPFTSHFPLARAARLPRVDALAQDTAKAKPPAALALGRPCPKEDQEGLARWSPLTTNCRARHRGGCETYLNLSEK